MAVEAKWNFIPPRPLNNGKSFNSKKSLIVHCLFAQLNIFAVFYPNNESEAKELLKCKWRTITSSKGSTQLAWCNLVGSQSDLQRLVFTDSKSSVFLPAGEDWGWKKVRCFWILKTGSLRCCWLCGPKQVLFDGSICSDTEFAVTLLLQLERIGIRVNSQCEFSLVRL